MKPYVNNTNAPIIEEIFDYNDPLYNMEAQMIVVFSVNIIQGILKIILCKYVP